MKKNPLGCGYLHPPHGLVAVPIMPANDDSDEFENLKPPQRRRGKTPVGMSTGMKVFIALAAVGGVGSLVCCGGGYCVFLSQKEKYITNDPAKVREITKTIISDDLPPAFQPKSAIDFFGIWTIVDYSNGEQDLQLVRSLGDAKQSGDFKQQIGEKGLGTPDSTEIKTVRLGDQDVDFEFARLSDEGGQSFCQATGNYRGSGESTIHVTVFGKAQNWDDDEVIELLKTIKPIANKPEK